MSYLSVSPTDSVKYLQEETSACPLAIAPQICANAINTTESFNKSNFTYSVTCMYQVISLTNPECRQCFILMTSLLITQPRHGFTLLIARESVVEEDAQKLLEEVNAHVVRFEPIELPSGGLDFHILQNRQWHHAYNKLHAWNLPYKKVLSIDADSLVLENIDHVFLQPDSLGQDALPHTEMSDDWVPGSTISGIILLTPSKHTFSLLIEALRTGWNETANQWRWEWGDQQLIRNVLHLPFDLPANFQIFPDTCRHSSNPTFYFPLRRMYIVHFAWSHKAYVSRDSLDEFHGSVRLCMEQMYKLYDYFSEKLANREHHLQL